MAIPAEAPFSGSRYSSLSNFVTLPTKCGRIVVFSGAIAREACFPCANLPGVGRVADGTACIHVSARLVQTSKDPMTGGAACQGLQPHLL